MVSRRKLVVSLILISVLALAMGLAREGRAASDGASDFIRELGDKAVATLADESLSSEARTAHLQRLFATGFDVRTISLFVLGRHLRQANKQQIREYLTLFEDFIVTTYAARFGRYEGETLELKGTRASGGRDVVVISEILHPGDVPLRVDWRVRKTEEGYKIVDVVVEGVSMLITQRDEFSSVIQANGKGFEGLLVALRERTARH